MYVVTRHYSGEKASRLMTVTYVCHVIGLYCNVPYYYQAEILKYNQVTSANHVTIFD